MSNAPEISANAAQHHTLMGLYRRWPRVDLMYVDGYGALMVKAFYSREPDSGFMVIGIEGDGYAHS